MTKKQVSPEDFVRAFESGGSADEVAKTLNMSKVGVINRAKRYRAAGVKLKFFTKAAKP